MWPIFILILVVVGAFAVWFNYWNHKNPVGKKNKPTKLNLDRSYEYSTRPQTVEETEQTKRILEMMKRKEEEDEMKK